MIYNFNDWLKFYNAVRIQTKSDSQTVGAKQGGDGVH